NSRHWRTSGNNYPNNMDSWVESPTISFPENTLLTLSMDVRYKTAENRICRGNEYFGMCFSGYNYYYDGMRVEYTVNGVNWEWVGGIGGGTNWYNEEIDGLGAGWGRNNENWQRASIVLPAELAGKQ